MKALPKIRSRRMLSGGTSLKKRQPSASIASNDPRTPEVNQLAVHRWSYGRERWLKWKLEVATREFSAETVAMLRGPRAQRSADISKVRRECRIPRRTRVRSSLKGYAPSRCTVSGE